MTFDRHCWAEIDLDALQHNFSLVRQLTDRPICAVVKADAYGHGDAVVAHTLEKAGAAAFAVSCLAEAVRLRRLHITRPILILGYVDPPKVTALTQYDLTATVHSLEYAQALSDAAAQAHCTVQVHLKVDTGMGRIGFCVRNDFDTALAQLVRCYTLPGLQVTGLYQHFAAADTTLDAGVAYTRDQLALFQKTAAALRAAGCPPGTVHFANSAGILGLGPGGAGLVRAGIILYGLDPSAQTPLPGLHPVMTLKAVVEQVKDLLPGQSVSYGCTYTNTTGAPRRVATVTVGYADGYPRRLSGGQGGGVMLVRGRPAPVLGRVCMDQTVIDVTGIDGVAMGDEVTVFGPAGQGKADTAETIAAKTDTIGYEIVTGVSLRVPRVYIQSGEIIQFVNYLDLWTQFPFA